ncbi:hypothetical protein ACSBOB_27500 [Mesorhizobium sp. ASY16-5R]|uniref:hypothetical protein n=1 Tax=Mesorhizobium sp. ASY16-5R TaxID=3445772 RepID=UPI003F9FB8DF
MTANRRGVLAGVGAAIVVASADWSAVAASGLEETMHLSGTISYSEKGPLPAGVLKIRLEGNIVSDRKAKPIAELELQSSGRDETVPFEMQVPRADLEKAARPGFTVRLERADGWLLALEPQAEFHAGDEKVSLTVNQVMY